MTVTLTLAADPPMPQLPPLPMPPWKPGGPAPLRQLVTCPTCSAPVASLLSGCKEPRCRRADLDYDAALDRRCDL